MTITYLNHRYYVRTPADLRLLLLQLRCQRLAWA